MEAQSEYAHIAYTFLARFGATLYAQSVIINTICASELSRKLIKSALLVGQSDTQLPFLTASNGHTHMHS